MVMRDCSTHMGRVSRFSILSFRSMGAARVMGARKMGGLGDTLISFSSGEGNVFQGVGYNQVIPYAALVPAYNTIACSGESKDFVARSWGVRRVKGF